MREKLFRLVQNPWLIALVALLLRLAWLGYKISVIPREVLATLPFENEVGNVASALASGHGFCCLFREPTGPTAWLSPVYPLIIAAIFKIFGTFTFRAFCVSITLNCVFSALACLPLFRAGERIAGKPTAALATWLWAVSPIAIIISYVWIWDTSFSTLLAATLLWATLYAADRPTMPVFALYGLLWGVSLLTNPTLAALLPFLLIWIFLRLRAPSTQSAADNRHPEERAVRATTSLNPSAPRRLQLLLVSFAVLCTTCLPWTIRNYRAFHRFIPLRSNFAYEFWSGNNPVFDPNSREINRITRYEQTHLYARFGESTFLDGKWLAAATFIRYHPALYAQLCAQRVVATWFGTASPLTDFLYLEFALELILAWNALSFFAMLAGLVRLCLRRRAFFFPVAVFPLIFPITFYIAHTSLRHRHPIDPILALLIAVAFLGVRPHESS